MAVVVQQLKTIIVHIYIINSKYVVLVFIVFCDCTKIRLILLVHIRRTFGMIGNWY